MGEPAHVHVDCGQQSAKFWVEPLSLARNLGIPAHRITRIRVIIENNQDLLLEAWHDFFGR